MDEMITAALMAPDARSAVENGDVGAIIRTARRARKMQQGQLANEVGYISQSTVSRLERSATRATADVGLLADIATALGLPPQLLGVAAAPEWQEGVTGIVGGMQRREFLRSTAAATAVALLPQSITSLGVIGTDDVEQAWRSLARLFELDDRHGGVKVHDVATEMAHTLGAAVRTARYPSRIEEELRAVAATAMEHAGWLNFDAGNGNAARAWWLETVHLSNEVGDVPQAYTAALASMSLQASIVPALSRETAPLAQAARRAAKRVATPVLCSVLSAREAVGHAQTGNAIAARAAMSAARRELGREAGGPQDRPLWLQFWSDADLSCHETKVALALGELAFAESSARSALASVDEALFPRNHVIYATRLSGVLVRRRKIDEAVAVTNDAVQKIDRVNGSRRAIAELSETLNALERQGSPSAKGFAQTARRLVNAQ